MREHLQPHSKWPYLIETCISQDIHLIGVRFIGMYLLRAWIFYRRASFTGVDLLLYINEREYYRHRCDRLAHVVYSRVRLLAFLEFRAKFRTVRRREPRILLKARARSKWAPGCLS
jgi:hypothetical protein